MIVRSVPSVEASVSRPPRAGPGSLPLCGLQHDGRQDRATPRPCHCEPAGLGASRWPAERRPPPRPADMAGGPTAAAAISHPPAVLWPSPGLPTVRLDRDCFVASLLAMTSWRPILAMTSWDRTQRSA